MLTSTILNSTKSPASKPVCVAAEKRTLSEAMAFLVTVTFGSRMRTAATLAAVVVVPSVLVMLLEARFV